MKKTVLVVLLALGSLIKADLGVVQVFQNESHIHSDAKIVQEALSNSDESVVNKELVKAFSDAIENGANDRQQNLHNTFNDYLKRPNDALDVFVKSVIDTNFLVKHMSLFILFSAGFVFSHYKIDDTLNSVVGFKFAASLFVKFLAYGILYHSVYNGLRFMLERVMPVSYTKSFNEKLLAIYNRFPRMSKYLGCFVGLFDAFATHYL